MVSDRPDTAALVRAHVAAFNTGDVQGVLATLTPDMPRRTGVDVLKGKSAVQQFLHDAAGLTPRLTIRSLVADHGRAAAELVETYTRVESPDSEDCRGLPFLGRLAALTVYREGSADK